MNGEENKNYFSSFQARLDTSVCFSTTIQSSTPRRTCISKADSVICDRTTLLPVLTESIETQPRIMRSAIGPVRTGHEDSVTDYLK